MKKRTASILVRCIAVAAVIIFELIIYFVFGEESVMQRGALRTLWILFPCLVVLFTIAADLIIGRIYKNKSQK